MSSYRDEDAIVQDIERTRRRMEKNIDHITDKFSVSGIVGEMSGLIGNPGSGNMTGLLDKLPSGGGRAVPLGLIGIGAALLLSGNGRSSHDDDYGWDDDDGYDHSGRRSAGSYRSREGHYDDAPSRQGAWDNRSQQFSQHDDSGNSIKETYDEWSDSAKDTASRASQSARRKANRLKRKTSRRASRMYDTMEDRYNEQPLIGGLVAAAAGAFLGMLLPPTRKEDEFFGQQRDELKESAMNEAHGLYDDIRDDVAEVAKKHVDTSE